MNKHEFSHYNVQYDIHVRSAQEMIIFFSQYAGHISFYNKDFARCVPHELRQQSDDNVCFLIADIRDKTADNFPPESFEEERGNS